jgi:hypothetical protein
MRGKALGTAGRRKSGNAWVEARRKMKGSWKGSEIEETRVISRGDGSSWCRVVLVERNAHGTADMKIGRMPMERLRKRGKVGEVRN